MSSRESATKLQSDPSSKDEKQQEIVAYLWKCCIKFQTGLKFLKKSYKYPEKGEYIGWLVHLRCKQLRAGRMVYYEDKQ